MFKMGITTATTPSIGTTIATGINEVVHMFHLKITKLHLGRVEVIWCGLRIWCRR